MSVRLFLSIPRSLGERKVRELDPDGLDSILEALPPGKGFIVVGSHVGPWEFGGFALSSRGMTINTVAWDHPSQFVTGFFNKRRMLLGVRSHKLEGSFGLLKKCLDKGECVVLLIDRNYGAGGKEYYFLGKQRLLPTSHLLLAARCRVPIVTGAVVFDPNGGLRCIFKGPYYMRDDLSRSDSMDTLQEQCLTDLETVIKDYPDQYFHFQPLTN